MHITHDKTRTMLVKVVNKEENRVHGQHPGAPLHRFVGGSRTLISQAVLQPGVAQKPYRLENPSKESLATKMTMKRNSTGP